MSFLRPVAARRIARWSETVVTGAVALACLWSGLAGAGHRPWLVTGAIFAAGSVAGVLAVLAAVNAYLGSDDRDPGVVTVEEGRIAYFGPSGGGFAELDGLRAIVVVEARDGHRFWRFDQPDMAPLMVPVHAEGAAQLTDVLAALPGFSLARAAQALVRDGQGERQVWRRPV